MGGDVYAANSFAYSNCANLCTETQAYIIKIIVWVAKTKCCFFLFYVAHDCFYCLKGENEIVCNGKKCLFSGKRQHL